MGVRVKHEERTKRKWRIIPRVSYTNYRKDYGEDAARGFPLFSVRRYWDGRIINVGIRYRVLSFDFRRSWLSDLMEDERR